MEIYQEGPFAYLSKSKAAVVQMTAANSNEFTIDKTVQTIAVKKDKKKTNSDDLSFVSWGTGNKLPMEILEKAYKNVTVASNLNFNSQMAYGDGLMVVKKVKKDGKITYEELLDSEAPEVFDFIHKNNVIRQIQEMANDFSLYYDSWCELIFDASSRNSKIINMAHKEMCYSRVTKANAAGIIEYHGYSTEWSNGSAPKNYVVSPIIDRNNPIDDITAKVSKGEKRLMLNCSLPTPGRYYYNKPWWWSIFESGWYDFACAIPEFKRALLNNQAAIRFHVKIRDGFFKDVYATEGIVEKKKQNERKMEILSDLDKFLAGKENAGKPFVSTFKYNAGKPGEREDNFIIDTVKTEISGGEYINDSEEANNIICYGMGVHPSLIGASPGKSKNINGTEARELFIIKQAMTKSIRDMLLSPLYIVKKINKWDPDIHFVIPNIMLTTLDEGTGSVKAIGNQKM